MGILSKLIGDYPTVVFKEITTKKQLQHLYDHGGIALDDYTPYFINYPNDLAEILYHVMADRDSDTCVVYLIKGRTMNNICRLTGVNAYQNEHPIICFSDYDRDMENTR